MYGLPHRNLSGGPIKYRTFGLSFSEDVAAFACFNLISSAAAAKSAAAFIFSKKFKI